MNELPVELRVAESAPTWPDHLRVIARASAHYASRMFLGLSCGFLISTLGAVLGVAYALRGSPLSVWHALVGGGDGGGVIGAVFLVGSAIVYFWRPILAVPLLCGVVPVGYFMVTQSNATAGAIGVVVRERPLLISWAVRKVITRVETIVPDLWTRTVNWDHRVVQRGYSALEGDGTPRFVRFVLNRLFRKVDLPALLMLEIRAHGERYAPDEVKSALEKKVHALIVEKLTPNWWTWAAVLLLEVVVVFCCWLSTRS